MRKTKIVCTIGPASRDRETLREMLLAGMNVARLNFSHGSHEEHRETINRFRSVRDELDLAAAVLLDTKGPEIRIKNFEKALKKDGKDFTAEGWDWRYYADRAKRAKFSMDENEIRPYLQLENVRDGMFILANKLYGVSFTALENMPLPHPEAQVFECKDKDGTHLGVLYLDFFPRASKRGGAWCGGYRSQTYKDGKRVAPVVTVVCNFTKPSAGQPALLTADEAETMFHEFGHALHAIFSQVRYEALSCTNVYWDFVELPSQFMENYAIEPEFLATFARHYETDEPMPEELITRIRESRNFQCGYACCRQVSFCLLDMAYYTLTTPLEADIPTFEREAWAPAIVLKSLDDSCMSVRFGHIMSGGYSAGYYSYKWAEVLEADAFSLFKEKGIFNTEVSSSFRENILSKGGTEDADILYRNFRGHDPQPDALMEKLGLTK